VRVEELEPQHYEALKRLETLIRERFYAQDDPGDRGWRGGS
jgi:hypothetical protein